MKKLQYTILKSGSPTTYDFPIFLDNTINNLGVMVGFDGDIEQIEQRSNFTYAGDDMVIKLYNTVNTSKTTALVDSVFDISWGDGSSNSTLNMVRIGDTDLPFVDHTYLSGGTYTIKVTITSPWDVKEISKDITIPFISSYGYPRRLGTLTFIVPYVKPVTYRSQEYLIDYGTTIIKTQPAIINFLGVGKSRLDELREYGDNPVYSGVSVYIIDDQSVTGYTIDNLYYRDYPDGYTYISGTTMSSEQFFHEEVYNGMITRNEHFLGFVEEPIIFSDVFIERGKMGVMEKNLRLSEIDNVGELDVYGNGYFNVRKQ